MKNLIRFTALLTLICQTSNAQPSIKFKGHVITLDTAIVFNIKDYRAVRQKVSVADQLITGLQKQRDSMEVKITRQNEIIYSQRTAINAMKGFITESRKTSDELNKKFDKLYTQAIKPDPFYKNPLIVGPVCISLGILAGVLIAK
jgi:hypothetical protein